MSEQYDGLIRGAALRYGVPASLVKAIIAAESDFDPHARREEPALGDRSRGLMQILEATARALGFTGNFRELLDPLVNIDLGTQLLRQNFDRGRTWPVAVSAYNAGWSPIRPNDAKRNAAGDFVNAPYVAKVLRLQTVYAAQLGIGLGLLGVLALGALLYATLRKRGSP